MAAISISPAVTVVEKDLSNVVPAVASTPGATAGNFAWGPVMSPTLIGSENELVRLFGKPNAQTGHSFFTAANFLSYGGAMYIVRAETAGLLNASAAGGGLLIKNLEDYEQNFANGEASGRGEYAARYAGVLGNNIAVSVADAGGWSRILAGSVATSNSSRTVNGTGTSFTSSSIVGDLLYTAAGSFIGQIAAIVSDTELTLTANSTVTLPNATGVNARWEYFQQFTNAPTTSSYVANRSGSNDEIHAIVYDKTGGITGIPGTILEKYEFLSKAKDAKDEQGAATFYASVISSRSEYVYWVDHPAGNADWGNQALNTVFTSQVKPLTVKLTGGSDGADAVEANIIAAFDTIVDDQQFDVSFIAAGKANTTIVKHLIQNIAEVRKDCIVFASPEDVNNGSIVQGATDVQIQKLIAYRNQLPSSSYGFLDSGYKYQYDKYNDIFRWVPLNGDMAGLCTRTDLTAEPWFSPGGFNRGQVKSVVKLAVNPNKVQRDSLYAKGVNPVVSFAGQGTVLFGDKTLLAKPSAFDRINVRRLFIVLEKAIATASKFILFEQNDDFTRRQFVALVEPFLRDAKGRRGLTDFKVVCDATNNTPQVIDNNEFRADIFIAPTRSINFITLTFVATRSGANFSEIAGA